MEEAKLTEVMSLKSKSLSEIKTKHPVLFAQIPTTNNKVFLLRNIAYKLQEQEQGGLSIKAREKVKVLIKNFDPINNKALRPDKPIAIEQPSLKDRRLPIPGTVITKEYKGANYQIKVLERGFEYNGKIFKTLSAIAKEITGAHWNGYLFFNL